MKIEELAKEWEAECVEAYKKTKVETPPEFKEPLDAATNGFDLRGALGNRFSRDPNGGKCEEYKRATTEAKKEFREKWAQNRYDTVSSGKLHTKSYHKVDSKDGTYRSFGSLLREEGGDTEAFERVKNANISTSNYSSNE